MENLRPPDPYADVAALEVDIGLPGGFFFRLLQEGDDWSFVIKTHALVEAAVSHLLAEVLGDPRLLDVFTLLELSDARTGKVAFAKLLGCLDAEERQTIRKLSELRNQLVHDVSRANFELESWAGGLDKNQLKEFMAAFGPTIAGTVTFGEVEVPATDFFRDNPRVSIWLACFLLLSLIYGRKDLAKGRRELDAERQALAERMMDDFDRLAALVPGSEQASGAT
jgi:hypothetical protein